jgi:hypothetical protein
VANLLQGPAAGALGESSVAALETAAEAAVAETAAAGGVGAVTLVGAAKAALITVGVALLAWMGYEGYGAVSAKLEQWRAEQQAQEQQQRVQDHVGSGFAPAVEESETGYYAVQLTNDDNGTLSVQSVEKVESGTLRTCDFLHGGLCAADGGRDTPASLDRLGRFDTAEEAWAWLCGQVTNVQAPALASGHTADYKGTIVSIESSCK